jgi:hypothetical protein
VDAGDLMKRPADIIRAYYAHVGIDFRPHALSWQPSDRPEWQGGFRHWFTDVAVSSGLAEVPSRRSLDADQHHGSVIGAAAGAFPGGNPRHPGCDAIAGPAIRVPAGGSLGRAGDGERPFSLGLLRPLTAMT